MAGVWAKLRLIGLSNIHDLLDRAVDLNSIGALRQRIRDLEKARESVQGSSHKVKGNIRTVTREIAELDQRADVLTKTIERLLTDDDQDNDKAAIPKKVELKGVEKLREIKAKLLEEEKERDKGIREVLDSIEVDHTDIMQRLQQLEAMESSTKAMDEATDAIKLVKEIRAQGEVVSVDSFERRMTQRHDVATVRFEEARTALQDGKSVAYAEAEAEIAEMKKALAAKKQAAGAPAAA